MVIHCSMDRIPQVFIYEGVDRICKQINKIE
jgi:hypothetical protein